jgi:hypothetical protein
MVNDRHPFAFLVFDLIADDDEVHRACASGLFVDIMDRAYHRELIAWAHWGVEFHIAPAIKPNFAKAGQMLWSKFFRP